MNAVIWQSIRTYNQLFLPIQLLSVASREMKLGVSALLTVTASALLTENTYLFMRVYLIVPGKHESSSYNNKWLLKPSQACSAFGTTPDHVGNMLCMNCIDSLLFPM